jgi:hypothetical protein
MPVTVMVVGRPKVSVTPTMLSATIVWFGGQMTPSDAAAPLQSGPDPLPELLLLELLLVELLLPDSVSATTTREPSEATATSAPAPRSAYTSFDISLSSRFRRPQATARFNFEAAPFATIGYM